MGRPGNGTPPSGVPARPDESAVDVQFSSASGLRSTNGSLGEAHAQLAESRRRIVRVQEELRRHMAENLHGKVQMGLLTSIFWLRDAAGKVNVDPESATELISRATTQLQGLVDTELRNVARGLHPAVIRAGLMGALRSLAESFEQDSGIQVELRHDADARKRALVGGYSQELSLAIYRVVEEALTNVQKHANAESVQITLNTRRGGYIGVSVTDDGEGFEPATTPRGLGLFSIEDYCSVHGGRLRLETEPGVGTRLEAVFPAPNMNGKRRA